MKLDDVHNFEKLAAQIGSFYEEMATLAKKSPKDAINPFKLEFVNKVLTNFNELLGQDYRPFPEFDGFSSDDIPSNSDVTFILSQYIACAEKFRADNIYCQFGHWYWNIDDADPEDANERIGTSPPKKLTGK